MKRKRVLWPFFGFLFLLLSFLCYEIVDIALDAEVYSDANADWMEYSEDHMLEGYESSEVCVNLKSEISGLISSVKREDWQYVTITNKQPYPIRFGLEIKDRQNHGRIKLRPWHIDVFSPLNHVWCKEDKKYWDYYMSISKINNDYRVGIATEFQNQEIIYAIIVGLGAVICLIIAIVNYKKARK